MFYEVFSNWSGEGFNTNTIFFGFDLARAISSSRPRFFQFDCGEGLAFSMCMTRLFQFDNGEGLRWGRASCRPRIFQFDCGEGLIFLAQAEVFSI